MKPESKTVLMRLSGTLASETEIYGVLDTCALAGAAHAEIELFAGTATAAETAVNALALGETDDTAAHSDVTTDMDLIPAFTGGSAVGATVGFVLPARSSTTINFYRFNVDLLGRKRYVGMTFTPATAIAGGVAMVARLYRGNTAPSNEAIGTATAGCRLVVSG
jgi:hypothetical protein